MTTTYSTTTVDILRHGKCEGGNIFRGSTDVPLTDEGFDSMKNSCARANCNWDMIVSSPLFRCRRFAKHLSLELNIPWEIEDRLKEMSFGDWDGKSIDAIWKEYEDEIKTWSKNPTVYTPPNAEPIQALNDRTNACRLELQKRYIGKHLLLVTHGGVIRVLISQVQGLPLENINNIEIPYACLSRYAVYATHKTEGPESSSDSQADSRSGSRSNTKTTIETTTKLVAHNFV